jgi:hypothetical protein
VVARWEGELDLVRAHAVLNGELVPLIDVDVEPQVDQEVQPRPVAVPVTKQVLA